MDFLNFINLQIMDFFKIIFFIYEYIKFLNIFIHWGFFLFIKKGIYFFFK